MKKEKSAEKIIAYLYGEMSEEDKAAFEAEAESNPTLREMLAQEQAFDTTLELVDEPEEFEVLLKESRLRLRDALRTERLLREMKNIKSEKLFGFIPLPVLRTVQFAVVLVVGVLIGRYVHTSSGDSTFYPGKFKTGTISSQIGGYIPVGFAGNKSMELAYFDVVGYDESTGDVLLSFDAVAESGIKGNLNDKSIRMVLTAALMSNLGHSMRLQAIDLLVGMADEDDVIAALSYALVNDLNPAVRLKAALTLKDHTDDVIVKKAMLKALENDPNSGVRLIAYDAVKNINDYETISVLMNKMKTEENPYLRAESEKAVTSWLEKTGDL